MVRYAVSYSFIQRFPFPAKDVYDWCVDYRSDDYGRMGEEGTRKVRRVDEDTLMLDDTVVTDGKAKSKSRLIKLYPDLLTWTNTRVSAAGRHSQFLYRIVPEGSKRSRLEFTGSQVNEAKRKPSPSRIAALSAEEAKTDSRAWVLLANELKSDLSGRS